MPNNSSIHPVRGYVKWGLVRKPSIFAAKAVSSSITVDILYLYCIDKWLRTVL